jgi:hypothetical protein
MTKKEKPTPEISVYIHKQVKPNGGCKDGGAVHTEGHLQISHPKGGCGLGRCNCSPGHWIAVSMPRTDSGVVKGITFTFNSRTELLKYLDLLGKG